MVVKIIYRSTLFPYVFWYDTLKDQVKYRRKRFYSPRLLWRNYHLVHIHVFLLALLHLILVGGA